MKSFREFHISLSSEPYGYIVAHLSYNLSLSCATELKYEKVLEFPSGEQIKLYIYIFIYVLYHSNSLFAG